MAMAFLASVLWATYYPLILFVNPQLDGAVLALPFLFGGLPFLAVAGLGRGRKFSDVLGVLTSRTALLCGALLAILQFDVILATRLAGAIPTAIFTLLGDVALIPGMNYALWREDGARIRRPLFWGGIALATVGASLTILGGGGLGEWSGLTWLVLLPLPLLVGAYFLLVAHAVRKVPIGDLVASASLLAFGGSAVGALALFGPGVFPGPLHLTDLAILVLVGVTTFFVAPWAFFEASNRLTVTVPAVVNATIPIFTMLLVVAFLGAKLTWLSGLGVPLAFLGSYVALRGPPSPAAAKAAT